VDPQWFYFLVYLDCKLVAYATTFDEFLKVPKAPLTISQVLVLPPYQKFGIGSTLLEIIYNHYLRVPRCLTMIVEDPADDFQRMKDGLDIKLILKAGFFRSLHGLGLENPDVYLT
jgi:histone acetyltransferase 1